MRLMYSGPPMVINNLARTIKKSYVQIISISKDSELDDNIKCKNYPHGQYNSYKDCDDQFIYGEVSKSGLMPFWATKDYTTVTKLKYIQKKIFHFLIYCFRFYNGSTLFWNIFDGSIVSPCYKPCIKSKGQWWAMQILQCG